MNRCDTCDNEYDQTFTVRTAHGHEFRFDSLECAAALIAPECGTCGIRILGHGVDAGGRSYCCGGCARRAGEVQEADPGHAVGA